MSHFGVGSPNRALKSDKTNRLYLRDKEGIILKVDSSTPYQTECPNCHQSIIAWWDENGMARYVCPRCGVKTVSKIMGKRHVRSDYFAPEGQVLLVLANK